MFLNSNDNNENNEMLEKLNYLLLLIKIQFQLQNNFNECLTGLFSIISVIGNEQ